MKKRGGGREDLKGGVPSLFRPSLSLLFYSSSAVPDSDGDGAALKHGILK